MGWLQNVLGRWWGPSITESHYASVVNPWEVPSNPSAAGIQNPYQPDAFLGGAYPGVARPVPTAPGMELDQIRADSSLAPYKGPLDLDDYGNETSEMRRAYLDLHRKEPSIRSAIEGKIASVATLDVSVIPEDKSKQNDVRAAEFVEWTIKTSPHGWDGLIANLLRPALLLGFSISEKVLKTHEGGKWNLYRGVRKIKSKDTTNLSLRLDAYRNILGVINHVRGLYTFSPQKTILFTNVEMFENPFGQSDLRAAYRAAGLIQDAYKLWQIALNRLSMPYFHGSTDPQNRAQMQAALAALRQGGYTVTDKEDEIEVLNLASATSYDAFEKKVDKMREDVFLAIRGTYQPFMVTQGKGGDSRGDTNVASQVGSDPVLEMLARSVCRCIQHQLIPDLVTPNFPAGTGMPLLMLGGVNWDEVKKRIEIVAEAKKLGLSVSVDWFQEQSQIPPANGPDDELPGETPPGGPGMPPPGPPGGIDGQFGPISGPIRANSGSMPQQPGTQTFSAGNGTIYPGELAHRFADYCGHDRFGRYPGTMHEMFGLDARTFADRSGLVLMEVPSRHGGMVKRWVRRNKEQPKGNDGENREPHPASIPAAMPDASPHAGMIDEVARDNQRKAALAKKLHEAGALLPGEANEYLEGDRPLTASRAEVVLQNKVGLSPDEAKRIIATTAASGSTVVGGGRKAATYRGADLLRAAGKLHEPQPAAEPDDALDFGGLHEYQSTAPASEPKPYEKEQELRNAKAGAVQTSTEPLTFADGEPGFTGEKKDSLGRRRCYQNGKEVPCPDRDQPSQPRRPKAAQKPVASAGKQPEATPAGHPGAAHGSSVKVAPVEGQKVFNGKPVETKTTLTKQETGRVGEAVIVAYLKSLGFADAGPMNSGKTNFPIDLIEDHRPTEVKAGLASNSPSAQQWRLTFSQESKAEKELYAKMTPEEREKWNSEKQKRIHERKKAVLKELSKQHGQTVKPRTMTVIINPDTRTADIYEFDGFHDRIGWNSPEAKSAYKATVQYS